MIDMAAVNEVHARMNEMLLACGARVDAVFFCPHTPEDGCDCRKPLPGMVLDIGRRYGVDLRQVPMVGDTLRDLQAAQAAGCEPHLVRSGRAAALDPGQMASLVEQVPGTFVHRDLSELAAHLLERGHVRDSQSGGLN
jgi:D-glycero-D-manno-heptose 1,7-bisphosphate phosphatase